MFVNDGSSSCPHLRRPCESVAMNVFEDWKTESDNALASLSRRWQLRRVNRAKHVMDAADKEIALVPKMDIKR
jgi:hypothetical protein